MLPKSRRSELNSNQLQQEGNNNKAINLFTKALQIEDNSINYTNRSDAFIQTEELELALQDCDKALQLDPNFVKAITNKAQILKEMGYLQKAIDCLLNIKNHTPESVKLLDKYLSKSLKNIIDQEELQRQNRLLEWLQQGNAIFSKIKIECYSLDYRDVKAKQTINAKKLILFIPKSHMITLEMIKETTIANKILQHRLDLLSPKHSFLSLFLLQEKYNPNSFWKPYIDILPDHIHHFPFSIEVVIQNAQKVLLFQISDLKKDYNDIYSIVPEIAHYSFNQFCWARLKARSRIFGINIKSFKTDAFVPLADMLNHRRPKLTSCCYSDEKQGFVIETDEKIEGGQMIFDSYGRKCNSRFLLNYGFVVEDNDANEVNFTVEADENNPLSLLKENATKESLSQPKTLDQQQTLKVFVSNIFRQYCNRIYELYKFLVIQDENQFQLLLNQTGSQNLKSTQIQPICIQYELDMWNMISRLYKKALNQYSTTFEQDKEILKICELKKNQRNCLILRMGEKEILEFFLQFSEK